MLAAAGQIPTQVPPGSGQSAAQASVPSFVTLPSSLQFSAYRPSFLPLRPRFSAEHGYSTSDKARKDGKIETLNQLDPSNHGSINLPGWRNVRRRRASVEVKPFRRLGLNFDSPAVRLASRDDELYSTPGSALVRVPKSGARSTDVGQEAYGYFKDELRSITTIGAGFAHLFAGQFLKQNGKGSNASYPCFFMSHTF
jgi:hypothetical protein